MSSVISPFKRDGSLLKQLLGTEEQELANVEAKVVDLQKDIATYNQTMKKCDTTLRMAREIATCSEQTISSLNAVHLVFNPINDIALDEPSSDSSQSSTILASLDEAQTMMQDALHKNRSELLRLANSVKSDTLQKLYDAERDVETTRSTLYFLNQSLRSTFESRAALQNRILQMRDLTTSRRRIPNELWARIFEKRVFDDEEKYSRLDLVGPAPFTALRLTWVCRLWRTIVTEQPTLWQYVAIPRSEKISYSQLARVRYYTARLRNRVPSVYTMKDFQESQQVVDSHTLSELFSVFNRIGRLRVHIKAECKHIVDAFKSLQNPVKELVLIRETELHQTPRNHLHLTSRFLPRFTESVSFHHIHPYEPEEVENGLWLSSLRSVHIKLNRLYMAKIISFLKPLSSLNSVAIEIVHGSKISSGSPRPMATLSNITTISCVLDIMVKLFDATVTLPRLNTVMIDGSSVYNEEAVEYWDSFLAIHQRRSTICTFGIRDSDNLTGRPRIGEICIGFINLLPSINYLILEGSVVLPTLERLGSALPEHLDQLTIKDSEDVAEQHLTTFAASVNRERSIPLSIQISECPSISQRFKGNPNLDLATLLALESQVAEVVD